MSPSRCRALVFAVCAAATAFAHADAPAAAPLPLPPLSPFLSAIHADYAYLHGITGNGVTVAVIDTGIDASHPAFAGSDRLLAGYDATAGGNVTDRRGHGTHVAGIIAGDGIGVAQGARLLPIKVFPDDDANAVASIDAGLHEAIGHAPIANLSLGQATPALAGAMRDAVAAGMLLVTAAGNTGAANPEWPARYAQEVWANNQIIAVGAVDASNRIATFSNRAGDTANWFLVAPGVDLASSYPGNRYMTMSGTSMATAVVSGAAALVKQAWPYLHADQIAAILLTSATDLGAPGVDPVYGHGLLNVAQALQPVGTIRLTTADGVASALRDTGMQPSAATSALWHFAQQGQLQALAFDDYHRGFVVDLGGAITQPALLSLAHAFDDLDQRIGIVQHAFQAGAVDAASACATPLDAVGRTTPFAPLPAHGNGWSVGAGRTAPLHFGAGASLQMDGLPGMDTDAAALTPAFFALVPGAAHAVYAQQLPAGLTLRAGMLTSRMQRACLQGSDLPPEQAALPRSDLALVELAHSIGPVALSLSVARVRELDTYLGAYASGALAFGPDIRTDALHLAGAWRLAPALALAGQLAYGRTPRSTNAASAITEITDTRTNAFSLALIAAGQLREGDHVSLSFSQPLHAYAGDAVLDMATGVDANGVEIRTQRHVSMVPVAYEQRFELGYLLPVAHGRSLAATLLLRRNPNNFDEAPTEKLLALRYAARF